MILAAVVTGVYVAFLGFLTTAAFQAHAVYLHKIQMTWFKNLDVPESFGFLRDQRIHVLTFDYRGFGRSKGTPSEYGLIDDAVAVIHWAMNNAGIPPSRILLFSQSLGTAVTLAVLGLFATQSPPTTFVGAILVAPFTNVPTLVATYRIGGSIPLLSPLARFPPLLDYLSTFIRDKWSSTDRIAKYIRANEENNEQYRLTLIHAEDDYDIPWNHTDILFWHAVNATTADGIGYQEFEQVKSDRKTDFGAAGSVMEWRTQNGIIRQEILKTGLHDVIMGNPVVTMAVMRILGESSLV
ncbi:MAG: hypothetical protein Q9222_007562 [Ikaeria aurantiellina]